MASQKNIVWVTLDSVRPDHTTMGGYERETTPNLAEIASGPSGQYFSRCFSSSTVTPISSGSILTGTHPTRHGLKVSNDYLPETLDTLPALLNDCGYTTAGISTNSYFSSGTGLNRGFDRFKLITGSTFLREVPWRTTAKYALNLWRHSSGIKKDTAKYATPFVMNDILTRWLDEFAGEAEPFFIYAHYNETHRPYYPPASYRDRFADGIEATPGAAAQTAMDIHDKAHQLNADDTELDVRDRDSLVAMYDAELSYTDEMIGRLFDHLRSLDLDDTVFIVTADHGELLGEDGLFSHTLVLRDELIRVPFVTHGLTELAHQRDEPVQHIDFVRTLVEQADGRTDQFQGIDLSTDEREMVVSQRVNDFEYYEKLNPEFDRSRFLEGVLTAFRNNRYKYVQGTDGAVLYELPDETTDVSDRNPGLVDSFATRVEEFLSTDGRPVETENDRESAMTEGMKRQLRDLGYLE